MAQFVETTPFPVRVILGQANGFKTVNKFGRNLDVDTGTEDVWDGGAVWAAPTQARVHNVASTDVNDAAAGSGARTIRVYGLTDWDTPEVSEDVTLNGTTDVATSNSYVIVHRMKTLTTGAGNTNAGVITATAVTDATVTAQIAIGNDQTLMAVYGISSQEAMCLTKYYMAMNRSQATGSADIELQVCESPDVNEALFLVKHHLGLTVTGTSGFSHSFDPYYEIQGPAIIKVHVEDVSNTNSDISAGFDGYVYAL